MRTITNFFRWALGLVMLLGLIACGSGELSFSEESMMSDYEQGRSDKDPDLDTSSDEAFDPACADLNGDGCVDVNDLNVLFDAWGVEISCFQACGGCPDINTDGIVGGADLSLLLVAWGYGESDDTAGNDADISDEQGSDPETDAGASDDDSGASLSAGNSSAKEDNSDDKTNKGDNLTSAAKS